MTNYKVKNIQRNALAAFLRTMNVGDKAFIGEKEFRTMSVYKTCYRLRKEGYTFRCSMKGIVGGCEVERTN